MKKIILVSFLILISSCKTFLRYENEDQLSKNNEFEKQVEVKSIPVQIEKSTDQPTKEQATESVLQSKPVNVFSKPVVKNKKNISKKSAAVIAPVSNIRLPELEDAEGFNNLRRPILDPFRVGEKVIHSVRFFAAEAGTLTLEVLPFLEVNQRKSYHFQIGLQTSRLFSAVYSVEDTVDTYLDFENMVPHVFKMSVRESGKLAQAQGFFNHETLKSNFWEKKYTKKNGQEDVKKSWDLLPFSQNAFSSIFYMRVFNWKIGKEYSFRVSDDEKNVIFKGMAIGKEKIKTEAGDFNSIKIKADIIARGALSTSHPLYIWISDDDRKLILRLEADIKIGSLVSEVIEIEKGNP